MVDLAGVGVKVDAAGLLDFVVLVLGGGFLDKLLLLLKELSDLARVDLLEWDFSWSHSQ